MIDAYGRNIDYMRISITDRCNLRCRYCMPEEGVPLISHEEILRYEEIEQICLAAAGMGMKHVRLTGGEPLVRRGVEHLVNNIKRINGIETVSLTTNGILLPGKIDVLAKAGIDGINISLDTVDADVFRHVTRGGDVQDVLLGIESVLRYPEVNLKLNCVLNDNWRAHVRSVAEIGRDRPVHIRFIERMPLVEDVSEDDGYERVVTAWLESGLGPLTPFENRLGSGPGHYYSAEGFQGKIGFISAISHKFCGACNRVRLTADGQLRLCLQQKEMIDLRTPLRCGGSTAELQRIIAEGLERKPKEHRFGSERIAGAGMSKIGG